MARAMTRPGMASTRYVLRSSNRPPRPEWRTASRATGRASRVARAAATPLYRAGGQPASRTETPVRKGTPPATRVADGEQGHGQGQQGCESRGNAAVQGGVPARVEDGDTCQKGDPAGQHPVDAGADRDAEGESDQDGERGVDRQRGPAERVPADRPLGLRTGAHRPTLSPRDWLATEDQAAEHDQHQREGAGGGHVEGDLELGEDLRGEGLVAEDLEGAVLGKDHQRDQDAATEDGAPRLPD